MPTNKQTRNDEKNPWLLQDGLQQRLTQQGLGDGSNPNKYYEHICTLDNHDIRKRNYEDISTTTL